MLVHQEPKLFTITEPTRSGPHCPAFGSSPSPWSLEEGKVFEVVFHLMLLLQGLHTICGVVQSAREGPEEIRRLYSEFRSFGGD